VLGPGPTLEEEPSTRADDVQIVNSATRPAFDVALDPFGEARLVLGSVKN
jgi:hypothetical protein